MSGKYRKLERFFSLLQAVIISVGIVMSSLPISVNAEETLPKFNIEITDVKFVESPLIDGLKVVIDENQSVPYNKEKMVIKDITLGEHKFQIKLGENEVESGKVNIFPDQVVVAIDSMKNIPQGKKYQYQMSQAETPIDENWKDINYNDKPTITVDLQGIGQNTNCWFKTVSEDNSVVKNYSCKMKITKETTPDTELQIPQINVVGETQNGWYKSIPSVTITKTDLLNKSYYTVLYSENEITATNDEDYCNGIELDGYNGSADKISKEITKEGYYNILVWAVNQNGTKSKANKVIKIDSSKPLNDFKIQYLGTSTIHNFMGEQSNNIFNKSVTARVFTKDDLSGISSISYHLSLNNNLDLPQSISMNQINYISDPEFGGMYYSDINIAPQFIGKLVLDNVIDNAGNVNEIAQNSVYENLVVNNEPPTEITIDAKTGSSQSSALAYNNLNWTNQNIYITLSGGGEIDHYEYAITGNEQGAPEDEESWNKVDGNNLEINNNLCVKYWFRAVGINSLKGAPKGFVVNIDKEIPIVSNITPQTVNELGQVDQYDNLNWTNKNICLQIDGISTFSGIRNYQYSITDLDCEVEPTYSNWTDFGSGNRYVLNINNDTNKKYWIRAINKANSCGPSKQIIIKKDSSSPSNSKVDYNSKDINYIRDILLDNTQYKVFKEKTNITFSSEDNYSGVEKFKYHIEGQNKEQEVAAKKDSESENKYNAEIIVEAQNKEKVVLDTVIDKAGNIEKCGNELNVIVDKQEPSVPNLRAVTKEGERYPSDNQTWVNKDVNIIMYGSEALSGINRYQYKDDEEADWHSISVDGMGGNSVGFFQAKKQNGKKTYSVRAVSNSEVIGVSNEAKFTVLMDQEKPSQNGIMLLETDVKHISEINSGGLAYKVFKDKAIVRFSSVDNYSGVAKFIYKINGQDQEQEVVAKKVDNSNNQYYADITIEAQNKGQVILDKVIDNAGNIEKCKSSVNIIVDNKEPLAPTLTAKKLNGTEIINGETWTGEDVIINISLPKSEPLSGISGYQYYDNKEKKWQDLDLNPDTNEKSSSFLANIKNDKEEGPKEYLFRAVSNSKVVGESNVAKFTVLTDLSSPTNNTIEYTKDIKDINYIRDLILKSTTNENLTVGVFKKKANIKFSSMDDKSGVAGFEYRLEGQTDKQYVKANKDSVIKNKYNAEITVDAQYKGKVILEEVKDNVGNIVECRGSVNIVVDNKEPSAPILKAKTKDGKEYSDNETIWTNKEVNIEISGSKALSGINRYQYYDNTKNQWEELKTSTNGENASASFEAPKVNEKNSYSFRAISNSEVIGESNETKFTVAMDLDSPSKPIIDYTNDQNYIRDLIFKTTTNEKVTAWVFKEKANLRFSSVDKLSGVKNFKYHIEGQKSQYVDATIVKDSKDTYYADITVEAQYKGKVILDSVEDNVGNITTVCTRTANIVVDNKQPLSPNVIAKTEDGLDYTSNKLNWTNKSINIKLDGATALSGIAEYQYCTTDNDYLDGKENWNAIDFEDKNLEGTDPTTAKRVSKTLTINQDTNKTYWFRSRSNSNLTSTPVSYQVHVQKTKPQNATLNCDAPNEEGWNKTTPNISIIPPSPTATPQPASAQITTYYKLWNTAIGENEADSAKIKYNGSNPPDVSTDGEYTFRIWTEDEAGNRSDPSQDIVKDIKVDLNSPQVSITYDNNDTLNGNYFKAARIATIAIDERNFDPSKTIINVTAKDNGAAINAPNYGDWTNNGGKYITSIPFTTDGDYTIDISCKDKADNTSNQIDQQQFTVDLTEPKVEISNVADLSANKEAVKPVISYSDTNLDLNNTNITLEGNKSGIVQLDGGNVATDGGQAFTFNSIDVDDNYVLSAKIIDKAGNEISKKVSFSVNQNGSTFEFLQKDIINNYTNRSFTPQIKVSNVDEVTILSLTLNGKNEEYTFEDGLITFADEINTDGKYVIGLDVKDAAGNITSMEPIEFFFDNTSPKVQIEGVDEGGIYFEKVNIKIKPDNVNDMLKQIIVNDETLSEEDYVLNDDGSIDLSLEDYKKYNLQVVAKDKAGNTNEYQNLSFEITNNAFVKFYMNKPLFYATVGVVSVVSVGGALFAVFGKGLLLVK